MFSRLSIPLRISKRFHAVAQQTVTQQIPIFYSPTHENKLLETKSNAILSQIQRFPGFVLTPGTPVKVEELASTHCKKYIDQFIEGTMPQPTLEHLGIPWSPLLVQEVLLQVGCTINALHTVLNGNYLISGSLHGGFHHAFFDKAYSFSVFNDLAIAANLAIQQYHLSRVLILDLDAEQGDGTASLFQKNNFVTTISVHSKKSNNLDSKTFHSKVDIECDPIAMDTHYSYLIRKLIPKLLDTVQPQLIIFQAGVGMLEVDSRKLMKLTRRGIRERNQIVYDSAIKRKIPTLITCGSSKSNENFDYNFNINNEELFSEQQKRMRIQAEVEEIIEAHTDVYRDAIQSIVQHNHRSFYF